MIYIGKGCVRERYREFGRDNWGVTRIGYSIIENDEEAYKWEAWWIDRFRTEHGGSLPLFNQVGGQKGAGG